MTSDDTSSTQPPIDQVGYWSELKLEIIREYARAYSVVMCGKKARELGLKHAYVDAFAGTGVHVSKTSNEFIPGSPTNALLVRPPFEEYFFVDMNSKKVSALQQISKERSDVHVFQGDCNQVLLEKVFPKVRYQDYKRALCILDPYAINLNWEVLHTAGQMRSIDMFLNFMIMDMNMNVLWRNPEKVSPVQASRMNAFWGDESWRTAAYRKRKTLFGDEDQKTSNDAVVQAFRSRLKSVAGFKHVPEPIPMRNSIGKTIYFLFFASQKPVAEDIVSAIFEKFRDYGRK